MKKHVLSAVSALCAAALSVCALGMTPLTAQSDAFNTCAKQYVPVGDCLVPANICDAVSNAYAAAMDIGR